MVSNRRRRTDLAFEVVFGPRLRRGLDHGTALLRVAALIKRASKTNRRKEKKNKRESMEEKRDAQKESNDLQQLCTFSLK